MQSEKPKIIDKMYSCEVNKPKLGNGSYGEVYPAYKLGDPDTKLACKILSKQSIIQKVRTIPSRWPTRPISRTRKQQ